MAKSTNKTLSTRISSEVEQFLAETFGTAGSGLAACAEEMHQASKNGFNPTEVYNNLEFLKQIRLYSLREIKGKFTPQEWMYLADSLNGTIITPEFRANTSGLIASVEDSADFDNLAEKWEVNVPAFIDKIKTLTGAQVDAVYTEVERFWDKSQTLNLEEWAKSL